MNPPTVSDFRKMHMLREMTFKNQVQEKIKEAKRQQIISGDYEMITQEKPIIPDIKPPLQLIGY